MDSLESLEQDNASLELEISELNQRKAELLKDIEKLKKKKPLLGAFAQLQTLLKESSDNKRKQEEIEPVKQDEVKRKRNKNHEDEYPVPEPITHEFFDSSISKYFKLDKNHKHVSSQSQSHDDSVGLSSDGKYVSNSTKADFVLLENIYRMFGITAFPVRDPSNHKSENSDLLGIRIEVFNQFSSKFETPHYIILQKNSKTNKWIIFKHTIPVFIQIHQLAKEYDGLSEESLVGFLQSLRETLQKVSKKHQIIERIRDKFSENVKYLEKDLSLEVLKFDLVIGDIVNTPIILNLSLETIESCHIERDFTESEKFRISNVLKGDINTFEKRLQDVIQSIR